MKSMKIGSKSQFDRVERSLGRVKELYHQILCTDDEGPLLVAIATYIANQFKDREPLWVHIIGPPSTGKTATLDVLRELDQVRWPDSITKASLLSGKLEKGGDVVRIGSLVDFGEEEPGILVFKDFTTLLSTYDTVQKDIFGVFRSIHDGSYQRDTFGKMIRWKGKVGILTGCTPAIYKNSVYQSEMGERFISLQLRNNCDLIEQSEFVQRADGKRPLLKQEIKVAVVELVNSIPSFQPPRQPLRQVMKTIGPLAALAALARSGVTNPEGSTRLTQQLLNLCYALSMEGCTWEKTHSLLTRVAFDSIPPKRREIIQLLHQSGPLSATSIASQASIGVSKSVLRELDDMRLNGLVRLHSEAAGRKPGHWGLSDELGRYLSLMTEPSDGTTEEIRSHLLGDTEQPGAPIAS